MTPGDSFAVMSVAGNSIWSVYDGSSKTTGGTVRFSIAAANPAASEYATNPTNPSAVTLALGGTVLDFAGAVPNPADLTAATTMPTASITGEVYRDLNGNGLVNSKDPNLVGMTVTLTGTSFAGTATTRTAVSAGDAGVTFGNVPAGKYQLTATDPTGKTLAAGAQGGTSGGQNSAGAVAGITLLPGDNAERYALGRLTPASVSGRIFADTNFDRLLDNGETGLAGVTVTLTGVSDLGTQVIATTTTDSIGNYLFDGLRPGHYAVAETPPAGYSNVRLTMGSFAGLPRPVAGNGSISHATFESIQLVPGAIGNGYNFAEWVGTAATPSYTKEVDLTGTATPGTVVITLGQQTHTITINGVTTTLDATIPTILSYTSHSGTDQVTINGLAGAEVMTITPSITTLILPGLRVELNNSPDVTFHGGVNDVVTLYDAPGDDAYVASLTAQTLDGPGYHVGLTGVSRIFCDAIAGGNDTATLTDSTGTASFKATPGTGRMTNATYYDFVSGFKQVTGIETGSGSASASLYDSPGNDTFVSNPATSTLSGPGFSETATGFARVDGYSIAGGHDVATLTGSAGDDRFYADPLAGHMMAAGTDLYAHGFAVVTGSGGSGGADRAYLTGTQASDVFTGTVGRSELVGPGLDAIAQGFPYVQVSSGGVLANDTGTLTDSLGNATFEAVPGTARIYGNGSTIVVNGFTKVVASATTGGTDHAILHGSTGNDTFIGTPGQGRLLGFGFDNSASGFGRIDIGGGGGGTDIASLTESAGDNTLSAAGSGLALVSTAGTINLSGFQTVIATAKQRRDRSKVGTLDFLLNLVGGWNS